MEFCFPNFSLGAGNMLVFGQANTGKSTLLKWAGINFMLTGGKVLYFDIAKGAYVTTELVGGSHIDLDNAHEKVLFAPIQTLSESRLCDFIFALIKDEKEPLSSDKKATITSAVKMVKPLNTVQQTISNLIPYIMDTDIKSALQNYTVAGGHYPLFDASTEVVDFNSNWLCLESKATFESSQSTNSVLAYVFSRVEELAGKKPLLIIFDDAGVPLNSRYIKKHLPTKINNFRKKNISFVFGLHQLSDISDDVKDVLLNHCNIRIYTPNSQVLNNSLMKSSYQSLGLSDTQLDLLGKAKPCRDYMIQTAGGKCQIIDLMINPKSIAQIITGGSNISDISLMEKLITKHGHDEAMKRYLKKEGCK